MKYVQSLYLVSEETIDNLLYLVSIEIDFFAKGSHPLTPFKIFTL